MKGTGLNMQISFKGNVSMIYLPYGLYGEERF